MKFSVLLMSVPIAATTATTVKSAKSTAGGSSDVSKASKQQTKGCTCDGDVEYVFNHVEDTWMNHYLTAKSRGCEMASISGPNEQFQAISAAALGWQIGGENTTNDIHAVWIGGKRISAAGGGRNADGSVDEAPWRWSDGTAWGWTNWNYNEPTNGRYCDEEDQFCYENRVCMQVLDQVYPLSDINGNSELTLNAGDWHDNPQNLIFPGLYKCCYSYQCEAVVQTA